ncbi:ribonuclease HI [filamentous cyanobacterium LEGE 11480]|uniref:Ribonuclease H n=1 Tax=Romeriopsis navalis LEGE 11480 TaxID=2777977 RepID=A0A928VUJ0_9CYAN|nr:ribonuclease HI [Romeriopsis navalis]MBE9032489.1 ribonuclease HI [Romeriopsis navalis LEGE 11480]
MTTPTIAKIYTDGACSGNPGPGGWGVVIYFEDGRVQDVGGAATATTNNRMELQASIAALEAYQKSGQKAPITLYTDSEYVRNGITKWISGWKKKGWKTAAGKPVMNQDLWQTLDGLNSSTVTWKYVKGHSGDPGNERADGIAVKCAHSQSDIGSTDLAPTGDAVTVTPTTLPAATVAKEDNMTYETTPVIAAKATKVGGLASILERLRIADEIATTGYLITTQELAELVGLSSSAISDRGEEWTWRNWLISRGRKEGNQILWQLERSE